MERDTSRPHIRSVRPAEAGGSTDQADAAPDGNQDLSVVFQYGFDLTAQLHDAEPPVPAPPVVPHVVHKDDHWSDPPSRSQTAEPHTDSVLGPAEQAGDPQEHVVVDTAELEELRKAKDELERRRTAANARNAKSRANRRDDYNEYMRQYMAEYRAGKRRRQNPPTQ